MNGKRLNRIKESRGSIAFDCFNTALMLLIMIVMAAPLWYIFCVSISKGSLVSARDFILFPRGFTLYSYELVLGNKDILTGYKNTLMYTALGTFINLVMTTLCAYPLSRTEMPLKNLFMRLMVFTMFFTGGIVPAYLNIKSLGMLDTIWAIILPGAVSTYNMIVMRSFFVNIPESLHESAYLDGANEWQVLLRIVLPLSLPVMSTMLLFYAVGHWNSYFNAMLYLNSRKLYPVQLFLRSYVVEGVMGDFAADMNDGAEFLATDNSLKFAIIVVTILPIICVYPFIQKYFVKGVMIGSVKG